jgi:Protein of unknown function (DUF1116)
VLCIECKRLILGHEFRTATFASPAESSAQYSLMTTLPNRETIDYARPFTGALWVDVLPRAAARPELPARVLLHAGPPFRGAPPAPVVNSAIQALLFEGLASNTAAARDLLLRGAVELQPAQDHGIVTPLAQVVSRSMLLVAVEQQHQIGYAPVIEGPAPALRFGSAAPDCLRRLREVSNWAERVVAPLVRRKPLSIAELIRDAVAAGDECHARTAAANEAMLSRLDGLEPECAANLRASPAFVLTILMAAAAAALRTCRCGIEAIGGNGIDFGVRRRGDRLWHRVPAQAPQGVRFAGQDAADALPAIGDSAVIDFCGLGGQALSAAPLLVAEWSGVLPADALTRRQDIIDPPTGIVDPERVVRAALSPLINLAILDQGGAAGLIGRGCYAPPASLFSRS